MRIFRRPLWSPDEGGGGDGDGSGDGGQSGGDTSDGAPQDGKSGNDTTSEDPLKGTPFEGIKVPEKFVKDGKVQTADLIASYAELERGQFRRRDEIRSEIETQFKEERAKAAPATPGDYTAPEKFEYQGREITVIQDDPVLTYLKGVAHKYGVPQAEFDEAVKGYVAASIQAAPAWKDQAKALGGEAIADKRAARVDGFLKANLSEAAFGYFQSQPATAAGIAAIEELMTLSGHPPFIPEKGDVPNSTYTKEELRKMQNDPRYTGEGGRIDPNFVAQVRAGFRRLNATG
jgi:hypothetical protein